MLIISKNVDKNNLSNNKDKRPDSDYDKDQLKMGIEIEKEHTTDEETAKIIAKDHLDEISDYYSRLKKMESEAEKE